MIAQDDQIARFVREKKTVREKKLPEKKKSEKTYIASTCCTFSELLLVTAQDDQMVRFFLHGWEGL